MATWAKQKLPRENGELVDMQVPIIGSFTVLIKLAILHGQTLLMG